jgi:hypothetical protein
VERGEKTVRAILLPLPLHIFFPARRLGGIAVRTGFLAGIRQEKATVLPLLWIAMDAHFGHGVPCPYHSHQE